MSRTTVDPAARAATEPPQYARTATGSQLDPYRDEIAAMLAADPTVAATVIRERLRRAGYTGGITILKDHLAAVRPEFLAARAFQRTSYLPGEIVQLDWWHTGVQIPVGKGADAPGVRSGRDAAALGAHAVVFTLGLTMADFLAALPGCLARLGGVAEKAVCRQRRLDRRAARGRPGAAPSRGRGAVRRAPRSQPVVLRPRRPTSKGNVERTIDYLETSFLPLRTFAVAGRPPGPARRLGGRRRVPPPRPPPHRARVAERWAVERRLPRSRCPTRCPTPTCTSRRGPARTPSSGSLDVDYSVPPAFVGRRVGVRVSPTTVRLSLRGHRDRRPRAAASCRPTSSSPRPMAGRSGSPARPATGSAEATPELPAVDLGRVRRAVRGAGVSGPAAAELAYLSRALKAPRIRAVSGRLAERARDEGWDYEAYLAAVLAEEVSGPRQPRRPARVKAARFPAVKTLDDFDFTVQTVGQPAS